MNKDYQFPHTFLKGSLFLVATLLVLWFTWSGQQFLAHNVYNDADSSFFIYGGLVLNDGGALYKDFWDLKPPAIFYQNALLLKLFGLNLERWALSHAIVFLTTLLWGIITLKKLMGLNWTLLWATLIAFAFNLNNYLDFGNRTEYGLAIFEMLAMISIISYINKPKKYYLILSGFFCAIATMYKPVGLASLLTSSAGLMIVYSSFLNRHFDFPKILKYLSFILIGFVLGISLCLYPILRSGQLLELWNAMITIPLSHTSSSPKPFNLVLSELVYRYGPLWGWLSPLLLIFFYSTKLELKFKLTLLWLILWSGATLSGIILMRHGHPHYYHPGVVPLITTACMVLFLSTKHLKTNVKIISISFYLLIGLTFSKYFLVKQYHQVSNIKNYQNTLYQPYKKVSSWLSNNLKNNETFYYWSMGYSPYIHSNKKCPGIIGPSILILGDKGAQMVIEDLTLIQQNQQVNYLLENPNTFPDYLSDIQAFDKDTLAFSAVNNYLTWRDQNFKLIELPELSPFLIYKKK